MPNKPAKKIGILLSCSLGSAKNVAWQIKEGCDIHEENDFGVPAIIIAARKNSAEIVRLLIEAGVDVNVKSPRGETVAYWAERHNNKAMKELAGLKCDESSPNRSLSPSAQRSAVA